MPHEEGDPAGSATKRPDGIFVAESPSLPGCALRGRTREEAKANIAEAIAGYLESLEKHGEPLPPAIEEETVEIP